MLPDSAQWKWLRINRWQTVEILEKSHEYFENVYDWKLYLRCIQLGCALNTCIRSFQKISLTFQVTIEQTYLFFSVFMNGLNNQNQTLLLYIEDKVYCIAAGSTVFTGIYCFSQI